MVLVCSSTLGFGEDFTYDGLNRLKTSTVANNTQTFDYFADGSMRLKTGVGTGEYQYPVQGAGSRQPHAMSSIPGLGAFTYDDNGNLLTGAARTVSWTSFDMPKRITKVAGTTAYSEFVYGSEHQRTRQDRNDGTSIVYAGAQETEIQTAGGQVVSVKTYWPNGIGVEIDRPGQPVDLNWTHMDRLGSPVAISDSVGVLKEKLAYDAWGKRRSPLDGNTLDAVDGVVDNKGFTNHEMLDKLDLVHMNGRVYDPFTARFMSSDPLIQDPNNGQSYNRYSYVLNNPTNRIDPTGYSSVTISACGPTCERRVASLAREVLSDLKKVWETGKKNVAKVGKRATPAFNTAVKKVAKREMAAQAALMVPIAGEAVDALVTISSIWIIGSDVIAAIGGDSGKDSGAALAGSTDSAASSASPPPDGEDPDKARREKTGKSERHGDRNAMSKAEKQIEKLKEELKNTTSRRDRQKIEQTIKNITQTAQRNAKGETHWMK